MSFSTMLDSLAGPSSSETAAQFPQVTPPLALSAGMGLQAVLCVVAILEVVCAGHVALLESTSEIAGMTQEALKAKFQQGNLAKGEHTSPRGPYRVA
jgi:hypothetical protein